MTKPSPPPLPSLPTLSSLSSLPPASSDVGLARRHVEAESSSGCIALPRTAPRPAGTHGDTSGTRAAPLTLARGQSFHAYASRGTVFHVQQGRVAFRLAPRWLSGRVWRDAVALTAGQVYVVETSGWLALTSDAGAKIALREDANPTRRLAEPQGHIMRRWRQMCERFGF
jgi:hypothetical protein